MSRRMRWAGHVARIRSNAYRKLVGNPGGKRPLERPRYKLVDNIKMNLRGIWWGGMDWIDLAQVRHQLRALLNTINLLVP
jgi:hypothetical protein